MDPARYLITWDVRAPLCMAFQSLLTAVLIWTTPKHSMIRWATLPFLMYLGYICTATGPNFTLQTTLFMCFTVGGYINALHCINFLCLSPLDHVAMREEMRRWQSGKQEKGASDEHDQNVQDTRSAEKHHEEHSWVYKLYFTTAALWSLRGVGTAWQPKSIPQFPAGQIPGRAAFIRRQVILIFFTYCLVDWITSQKQTPEAAVSWAEGKEWLWLARNPHKVTAQDLVARALATFMSWFLLGRLMLEMWHRIFSVIFVGSGISEVRQWPPLWGSYSDCFTLRRYFNKFWHQCNRIHLQGVASFTGRDLLGLGPGILRRYTITTLVFAISGLYHRLVDNLMGIDWHKSGGLTAFLLIVPGILLEDFVQTCWNRAAAPKRLSAKTRSLLERIVGYLWVFSWLMLVTPIYNYPIMRIDPDNSLKLYVIPWSLVNWLRQWK
ncbi:unnamed protein product [Zymoseptoria tritici ST99CH_1A5]|uniref:Wax synthase domain-containing protein n=3 Tax=Zymoseptoria tritici TaxID=1047171 RepID=A0A1X7RJD6_ZYMT9|nr:unnamed protein product [Zymoseptoria tritici ST99CH_3D7]SMR45640.1 unnamed protein product [Zymoseptoria tritici ST99CH_1E4]SMR46903.1 unnamed protein product [Zymoseptoria tritici ST99CH_3D1]SMY20797.1 unnamed protein product [Zymoseptoria tritici ST99CH_1A5]